MSVMYFPGPSTMVKSAEIGARAQSHTPALSSVAREVWDGAESWTWLSPCVQDHPLTVLRKAKGFKTLILILIEASPKPQHLPWSLLCRANMGLELQRTISISKFITSLAGRPWLSHYSSPCLGFPICKLGITILISFAKCLEICY